MTEAEMIEAARANVEAHLGDVLTDESTPDEIHEEAYTMAFDRLHDLGVSRDECGRIATHVAQMYACP